MKVSIVIPNWNLKEDCLELLESIQKLEFPKKLVETVVVDNNSQDGSGKAIREKFPWVRVIESKENLGYGGGVNLGIKNTESDYLLLLTNDVVLDKNFLKYLFSALSTKKDAGVAGGLVLFYDRPNVIQKAYGKIDEKRLILENIGRGEVNRSQYRKEKTVEALTFTGILFKREVFDKVGLFDERFFHSYEDLDFLLRIRKAGYKMLFVPKAKFWHKGSKSLGRESPQGTYYFTRNDLLIRKKYGRLSFIDHFKAVRFMISSFLLSLFANEKSAHYKAIVLAISDFYQGRHGMRKF